MKSIIVDDEPKARKVLEQLLGLHCPEVEVLARCENLSQARQALLEQKPELVFLDLHFPLEMGLDLVRNLPQRDFALVLTTAHADHAVEAFAQHAQDYLLKPIHSTRLVEAVAKAKDFIRMQDPTAAPGIPKEMPPITQLPLPVEDGIQMVEVAQIVRIEAHGSYSKVYFTDEKPLLICRNLKPLEQTLLPHSFYRIHHSHLINLRHLKKILRQDGGFARMSDGSEIEVSRRRMGNFLKFLEEGRGA